MARRVLKWELIVVLLSLLVARVGYALPYRFMVGVEEIARVTSPDSRVDAVLVRINGGATTSHVYNLFLLPKGARPPSRGTSSLLVADKVYFMEARLRWVNSDLLEVQYKEARIWEFEKTWTKKPLFRPPFTVSLRLVKVDE